MTKNGKNVNDGKNDNPGSGPHNSPASHNSHHPPPPPSERLLPPRGDYHTLLSFQKAEVIYDITFRFAHKFLAKSDRTIDQMIQQVRHLEQEFLQQGGLRERMTRARMAYRNGRYGKQGSNDGNAGGRGGNSSDGSSGPGTHSSPDSHSSQQRKPPDRRNPPRAPGGQP